MVELLIRRGVDPNARDSHGHLPLHFAAMSSSTKTVNLLLDSGVEVDCLREDRATALMIAADCGEIKIAELLILRGADLNARESHGYLPLHFAARSSSAKMVNLLLDSWG
jgi:ankyrin repeat protein